MIPEQARARTLALQPVRRPALHFYSYITRRSETWSLPQSSGDGEFFFQLLLLIEPGVVAIKGEQFVVPAQLHNVSVIEHGDLIGVAHSGDAMGDQNSGRGGGIAAEAAQNALFRVGVHAGQRVVEDEDGRTAQQGAGDGRALLLSAA